MKAFLLALATTVALPAVADAQAFTNGSFETANFDPGAFTQLEAGSTAIAGWSIDSGSIDYVGNYWNASNGVRSIDMSGGVAGSISQTFDTVAGRAYTVSFDLGGNGDSGPATKTLDVLATGGVLGSFSAPASTRPNIDYTSFTYSFVASGASTTLSFLSTTNTAFGPILDNVAVSGAVPEPATWGLMILGFGFIGGSLRQRRRDVAAIA